MVREVVNSWKARGTVVGVLLGVMIFLAIGDRVHAGHTFGNGDCWRGGTLICRTNWTGANTALPIRLIDQLNNLDFSQFAMTAQANWNAAAGPQDFRWSSQPNDSWVYLKRDDGMWITPAAYVRNYDSSGNPISQLGGASIDWSEAYFDSDNLNSTDGENIHMFAHEYGHTLGLYHHGFNSGVLMQDNIPSTPVTILGPTSTDIGSNPPCTNGGIRCIYNYSN